MPTRDSLDAENYEPKQAYYYPANAEIGYIVEYDFTPIVPGRHTLSNGDPGYPDEGGELFIISIWDEERNCDITHSVSAELENAIEEYIMLL